MRLTLKLITLYFCTVLATLCGGKTRPAILMYHSFDDQNWRHGVPPSELKKQLSYLRKKRDIVSLSEIVVFAKGEKQLSSNSVAITVDDGYEDTYTVLYPLAKKYNFPFTLFLTTDLSVQPKLGNLPRPTWDQLREMSTSGLVDIQVHGHSHINFPEVLERGLEKDEIEKSKQIILDKLGVSVATTAYPAGHYNEKVLEYFRKEGYTAGYTTRQGFINIMDDPMQLKRILVDRATTMPLFYLRLTAGYPIYLHWVHSIRKKYE